MSNNRKKYTDNENLVLFEEVNGIDCVHTIEAHNIEDVEKSIEKLKEYRL